MTLTDWRDVEYGEGSTICYPRRRGSWLDVVEATVTRIYYVKRSKEYRWVEVNGPGKGAEVRVQVQPTNRGSRGAYGWAGETPKSVVLSAPQHVTVLNAAIRR